MFTRQRLFLTRHAAWLRYASGLALFTVLAAPGAWAQSAQDKYFRAYYLENERGDLERAAELYAEVASSRADAELRSQAEARLRVCREELACSDFARLVPAETLIYAELSRPGDQLERLFDQLGLMASEEGALSAGGRRLAISPELVRAVLGVRGAALAVTGFNPLKGEPIGVLLVHPGRVEVIRGLIETVLPAGAEPVEAIVGHATYHVEGELYVTLTERLVLASQQRSEIEKVLLRLSGQEKSSLADTQAFAPLADSRGDELFAFCVNAQRVVPLAQAAMANAARHDPQLAMAMTLLDLESLKTLSGRAGVDENGLSLAIELELEDEHRNLVFNFMRLPGIERATLERVPRGAAGFLVAALNERRTDAGALSEAHYVSAMDVGREVFGNLVNLAVFALPATESASDAPGAPEIAAILSVNDPGQSQALWNLVLGLASRAGGATSIEGRRLEVEGVQVQGFDLGHGPTIYSALSGDEFVLASGREALARCLSTGRGSESVLQDPVFAKSLEALGEHATLALFLHPGRCVRVMPREFSEHEWEQMEQLLPLMESTVASLVVEHSDKRLAFQSRLSGIPKIGPLLWQHVMGERQRAKQRYAASTH